MMNFNRNRNSNGRGRDDRSDRQMHRATCADCGRDCEVPFKPSGDKPVYCSNCFKRDDSPRREERRGDRREDRREDRQMHRATCADCGENCEVPFKPSNDKPVYCSGCFKRDDNNFGKRDRSGPSKSYQSNEKHNEINAKLDKILSLLQSMNPVKEEKEVKPEKESLKEVVEKKPVKKVAKKATVKKVAKKAVTPKKTAAKKIAKKASTKKA